MEVGRTATIVNSSEPLWATEFHLPDELLLGADPLRQNTRTGVGSGQTKELTPPQTSPGVVALEVWDSVPEGDPVLLGAVEVPSDVLQKVFLLSSCGGQDARRTRVVRSEPEGGDDDKTGREGEGPWRSPDLHLLNLNLRLRPQGKQAKREQPAGIVGGENSSVTTIVAAKAAGGAVELGGGAVGTVSFSLKRVASNDDHSVSEERLELRPATTEEGPSLSRLAEESGSVAGLEQEVMGTRITEVKAGSRLLRCWYRWLALVRDGEADVRTSWILSQ